MKLAFTTLGCPKWDMETIVSRAVEYGFDGVDFRGYLGELNIYRLPEFTTAAEETARRFRVAGLAIPCFSSSVRLMPKKGEDLQAGLSEIKAYAMLCRRFQAPFIRIFGGAIGDTPRPEAVKIAAANLRELVKAVDGHGIQLLVETHDDWLDCHHLAAVLETAGTPSAGIVWDTHHPYRMRGEAPSETCAVLGKRIRYTHWKDSRPQPHSERSYQLCLVGAGDIPMREMLASLTGIGYDGYLTLEWEKMWVPEIEEPEAAFPAFVKHMRLIMN
jgi:sugar phosphate isomerase/epimerase